MIEIITPVEKPPNAHVQFHHIKYKNGLIARLFGAPKYKQSEDIFAAPIKLEPIIIDIVDEVDIMEWYNMAYNPFNGMKNLKRDVKIRDEENNVYILYGAFPSSVTIDGKRATLEYDKFVTCSIKN